MNSTKYAILLILHFLIVKGKKHYLVLSVDTLQRLLSEYHGIKVERRWIFYCTAFLVAEGYIARKRRWEHNGDNLARCKPSMLTFTLMGAKLLAKKSVQGAKELYQRTLEWIQREQRQWPLPADIYPPNEGIDQERALLQLRTLIKAIG